MKKFIVIAMQLITCSGRHLQVEQFCDKNGWCTSQNVPALDVLKSLESIKKCLNKIPKERLHLPRGCQESDKLIERTVVKFNAVCLEPLNPACFFLLISDSTDSVISNFQVKNEGSRSVEGIDDWGEKWLFLSGQHTFPSSLLQKGLRYHYLKVAGSGEPTSLPNFQTVGECLPDFSGTLYPPGTGKGTEVRKYDIIDPVKFHHSEKNQLYYKFGCAVTRAIWLFAPQLQDLDFKCRAHFERCGLAEEVIENAREVAESVLPAMS
eukprot:m.269989 g.269989  ORF g.269989 m.269989 type:complete len:265 (+) comp40542_c0_seq15:2208-3002(+)